eukprot:scaffold274667_cov18-Prasinocladus_malaysianus.AAC.1
MPSNLRAFLESLLSPSDNATVDAGCLLGQGDSDDVEMIAAVKDWAAGSNLKVCNHHPPLEPIINLSNSVQTCHFNNDRSEHRHHSYQLQACYGI